MQDEPQPAEILAAVASFLRDVVMPQATSHTAFQARVAANALDLVARQIALAPASEEAEHQRLKALLGRDGTLADLNRALADGIVVGVFDTSEPGLSTHLLETTLAKLAVDQPSYSGYRAALDEKDD
jgi:Domain of unknown function (DUF6285)